MKRYITVLTVCLSILAGFADELKDGAHFSLASLPRDLIARVPAGGKITFTVEENPTTGFQWQADSNTNECFLSVTRTPAVGGLTGAPGRAVFTVRSHVQTPARIELAYRRSWEKNTAPARACRVIVYTVAAASSTVCPDYPETPTLRLLTAACKARGITLIDWHLHIRGGMTPALAARREEKSGIRSSCMENHGREWEVRRNDQLRRFAKNAKKQILRDGRTLPVGIQVNDRDWFKQIDPETRAAFDYILADTMIMGSLPDGRANRLWLDQTIPDPEAWMCRYVDHTLQVLDEPISILANPTYLPKEIDALYDRLWTEERMRRVIAKAVANGIALEIQAGSSFPRPKFLKLAREMGAKFSFGTNNFDPTPKDLSRWLEVIEWLDLHGDDIWTPSVRSARAQSASHTCL